MATRIVAAIGFVLLLVLPARAEAMGFLSWLDRLSGPGPFVGTDVQLEVACFPKGETVAGMMPLSGGRFALFNCAHRRLDKRRLILLTTAGAAFAINNPLDYGDNGHQTRSTAIGLFRVGASVNYSFDMAAEIGTGIGLMYFAGPRFDNFTRRVLQPVRVAVRPLLLVGKYRRETSEQPEKSKHGWLILEADWTRLPANISARDFGAPGDPWILKDRNKLELGLYIDVYRMLKP